jgi:Nucleoporin protein Ndc1-Nup.
VYATIGCLDGKKPISTYSSDPINTLLSGLRNVDPEQQLCRLTAFQELAYLATTSEPEGVKLRTAIYNARSRRGFVWPAILDECSLIIKEITAAINYRSTSDLHTLRQKQIQIKQELSGSSIGRTVDDSDIFGNSFITSPIKSNSPGIQTYSEAKQPKKSLLDSYWYQLIEKQAIKPLQKLVSNLVSGKKSSNSTFAPIKNILVRIENTCLIYNERFLSSSGGLLFRTTLKRDTESRVVNAVSFGNAVIAISNLLIHSIEEDKNSTVTNNHIRDILELLEKPVRATSNYTDYLPASIILSTRQRENPKLIKNHLVAVMHDLCMHEFFQICVRFNFKLNDLVLNPRTYKLAKWVIDVAIAQQQQNHQKVANY